MSTHWGYWRNVSTCRGPGGWRPQVRELKGGVRAPGKQDDGDGNLGKLEDGVRLLGELKEGVRAPGELNDGDKFSFSIGWFDRSLLTVQKETSKLMYFYCR